MIRPQKIKIDTTDASLPSLKDDGWSEEDAKALQEIDHFLSRGHKGYLISQAIKDHINKYGLDSEHEIIRMRFKAQLP